MAVLTRERPADLFITPASEKHAFFGVWPLLATQYPEDD